MESSVELLQDPSASSSERTTRGVGHLWPVALIVLGLAVAMMYIPFAIFLPTIISDFFSFYNILNITVFFLAPLLYIVGVVFMHLDKKAGARERVRYSTIGGITLILGAIFGIVYLAYNILSIWMSSSALVWNAAYVLNLIIQPIVGIAGSLLGGYYALWQRSYTKALLAGGFSVLFAVPVFCLALVPIALGTVYLQRSEVRENDRGQA